MSIWNPNAHEFRCQENSHSENRLWTQFLGYSYERDRHSVSCSKQHHDTELSKCFNNKLLNTAVMNFRQAKYQVLTEHFMGADRPNLDQGLELSPVEVAFELSPEGWRWAWCVLHQLCAPGHASFLLCFPDLPLGCWPSCLSLNHTPRSL